MVCNVATPWLLTLRVSLPSISAVVAVADLMSFLAPRPIYTKINAYENHRKKIATKKFYIKSYFRATKMIQNNQLILTSFSTLSISGPTAKLLLTVVWSAIMLTETSPVLLNDDKPYNVPLALGLLFCEVLVLFLVGGFFVVIFAGAFVGFGLGLVALGGGFTAGFLAGFGVGFGVGFAFSEPTLSLIDLGSFARGVCSATTSLGFTSLA